MVRGYSLAKALGSAHPSRLFLIHVARILASKWSIFLSCLRAHARSTQRGSCWTEVALVKLSEHFVDAEAFA